MGARGPAPKRSTQRRRQNKGKKPDKVKVEGAFKRPAAAKDWHRVAKQWYLSLEKSGQSKYYEPSDWTMAYMLAESISRDLKPQVVAVPEETGEPVYAVVPMKGASLAAYLKGMTALLVSEADRRRAGVELERTSPAKPGAEEADGVAKLDEYRRRLTG